MEVNRILKITTTTDTFQYTITKAEITKLIDKGWRIVSMINVDNRNEIWVYMEKPDSNKPKKIKLSCPEWYDEYC